MSCAGSTTVSLEEWSAPCRMCGQLLLQLPDIAPPTVMTPIGTLCFECYPEYVNERLRTAKRWNAQFIVLMNATLVGLPRATQTKIVEALLAE